MATPAGATVTRHASPGGNFESTNECTDASSPCELQHAFDKSLSGDEVVIHPGVYNRATEVNVNNENLNIHGVAGQPRPRIVSSAGGALFVNGPGITLRHIEIENPGGGGLNFRSVGGVAQEVVVQAGTDACLVQLGGTLKDTLCWATGDDALAVTIIGVGASSTFALRNVTAIATGPSSTGLHAESANVVCGSGCSADVSATNTIARGTQYDVSASADPAASSTSITLSYSNFDPGKRAEFSGNAHVNDGGHNQAGAPLFAAPTDFHQAAGSPTIDAGLTDDASNGPFDFDGGARTLGAATDIGADEFVPAAPGAGSGADTAAPAFASLSLTNTVFAVNRAGAAERPAAAGRIPKGTTFRYRLSEAARVTFTVERALTGRRVGRRCVKPRRSNRTRRRCTRHRRFGRFAQRASAGRNSKRWSGKISRRRLSAGRHRATLVATDAAGNRSRPRRLRFRVVRAPRAQRR